MFPMIVSSVTSLCVTSLCVTSSFIYLQPLANLLKYIFLYSAVVVLPLFGINREKKCNIRLACLLFAFFSDSSFPFIFSLCSPNLILHK